MYLCTIKFPHWDKVTCCIDWILFTAYSMQEYDDVYSLGLKYQHTVDAFVVKFDMSLVFFCFFLLDLFYFITYLA